MGAPPQQPQHNLLIHARVYALAEKYDIEGLRDLAASKFARQMQRHCESSEFATTLAEVYASSLNSTRGLRDVCLQMFRQHRELIRTECVEEAVREIPDLAWELLRLEWGMPVY